jgi:hypothetical protein
MAEAVAMIGLTQEYHRFSLDPDGTSLEGEAGTTRKKRSRY